jgi:hypothetical protein
MLQHTLVPSLIIIIVMIFRCCSFYDQNEFFYNKFGVFAFGFTAACAIRLWSLKREGGRISSKIIPTRYCLIAPHHHSIFIVIASSNFHHPVNERKMYTKVSIK